MKPLHTILLLAVVLTSEIILHSGSLMIYDTDRDALVVGSTSGLGQHANVDGILEVIGDNRDPRLTIAGFGNSRPVLQLTNARGTQSYPQQGFEYGQLLGDIIWDGYVPARGLFLGGVRLRALARSTTQWPPINGIPSSLQVQLSTPGTTFSRVAEFWDWHNVSSGQTVLDLAYRISSQETAVNRIEIGPPDSCGIGYRCLRIPNQ